jgi:hypothetical protein
VEGKEERERNNKIRKAKRMKIEQGKSCWFHIFSFSIPTVLNLLSLSLPTPLRRRPHSRSLRLCVCTAISIHNGTGTVFIESWQQGKLDFFGYRNRTKQQQQRAAHTIIMLLASFFCRVMLSG